MKFLSIVFTSLGKVRKRLKEFHGYVLQRAKRKTKRHSLNKNSWVYSYPSPGRYSHFLITFIPFLFLFFRSIPSMQMWPSLLFCRVAVREDRAWFSLVTVVKAQSLLWYLELTVHRCSYGGIYSWQALTVSGLKVNSNTKKSYK